MKKSAILLVTAASFVSAVPQLAAQERALATVDGSTITEMDLQIAEADMGIRLAALSPEARRVVLLEFLIGNQLMAAAAKSENLDAGQKHADRTRYYQRKVLFEQFMDKYVLPAASPAEVKRAYDAEAATYRPVEEVRVRHMLVETEAQAAYLRERVAKGSDFAALAQAVSQDKITILVGGDLGYFAKGEVQPWLETAAFALKPGEISKPVKSEHGWHLIKLEERRMRPLQAFEAVKDRIRTALIERRVQEMTASLRAKAKVTVTDPARPQAKP